MLIKNDIICFKDELDNKFERILWINNKNYIAIQMNIDKMLFNIRLISDIENMFEEGICEIFNEELGVNKILEEEISQSQKEKRDKAYEIIKYIFAQDEEIAILSNSKIRSEIIKNANKKFNISTSVIYKYLRQFLQGGRLKNALLPNYDNCGGIGKRKKYNKKAGRKSYEEQVTGKKRGVVLDDDIRRIFDTSIKRYFYTSKERTLVQTYLLMIRDSFSDEIEGEIVLKEPNEVPTFEQFKYYYYKTRDLETVYRSRKGNKKFESNLRGLHSSCTYETFGPGYRYQLDATMADVYLVSRFDMRSVIGRPILYLIVDVFSRLITGFYIGLEGPSWNGASSAIYSLSEDKVELCKRYGIDISHKEWPSLGLPEILMGDRGEMVGPVADGVADILNIHLENTASYRGDSKPVVERNFRAVNDNIKHWTPGAVKKQFRERGERDHRYDAKLNIFDFTQIIIYSIIERNNSFIEDYPLTAEMIKDNVNPVPIELWNWGMEKKGGNQSIVPEDLLKMSLLRNGRASITERGIKFNNELYITNLDNEKTRYTNARISGYRSIDIKFDNRDMSTIYMVDKEVGKLIPCYLKKENQIYLNRTYEEVVDYNFNKTVRNTGLRTNKLLNKVNMNFKIEEIIKNAEKRFNGDINVKNIKENRKAENATLRVEQSLSKDTYNEIYVEEKNEEVVDSRQKHMDFIHNRKKKRGEIFVGKRVC